MEKVREISQGRVLVGPGTLYAMLAKFEENGVIRLTASEGRKKSYMITDIGRDMLWQEYVRLQVMVRDGSRFLGEKKEK